MWKTDTSPVIRERRNKSKRNENQLFFFPTNVSSVLFSRPLALLGLKIIPYAMS